MLRALEDLVDTLFDFGDPDRVGGWEPVGDRVMGGVSTGRLETGPGGLAVFHGEVLLANGGGFASVRSGPGAFDLSRHAGLLVEARGDGRTYRLSVRTDPWFDAVAYQARFTTRAGERAVHRLPFDAFRATWRGRPVPGAPPLDPSRICAFGIRIGEGQAGAFRLELAAIRAWRRPG